uniref:Uncharacterized protein n=1 Tax=Picea glauca TaxID=3330 RepID=A0A124GMK4_PICGL|nr:hypothetical protein ABT39_MTgene2069 [Picea glauca]QHR87113.1 hypothetical protein Q903MT_gene1122 [Picea sitchensis]
MALEMGGMQLLDQWVKPLLSESPSTCAFASSIYGFGTGMDYGSRSRSRYGGTGRIEAGTLAHKLVGVQPWYLNMKQRF